MVNAIVMRKLLIIFLFSITILANACSNEKKDNEKETKKKFVEQNVPINCSDENAFNLLLENGHREEQLKQADWFNEQTTKTCLDKAKKLYISAMEKGSSDAMYELGNMYFHGKIGEKPDYVKARVLFDVAYKSGSDIDAPYMMAYIYENGLSVIQDYDKAFDLYNISGKNGDGLSLLAVGDLIYTEKVKGPPNEKTSTALLAYYLAATDDIPEAKCKIVRLADKLKGDFYKIIDPNSKDKNEGLKKEVKEWGNEFADFSWEKCEKLKLNSVDL